MRLLGVNAHPRPIQRPLPVVIGGHSRAAHRRAARSGNGWYGFLLDLDETEEQVESLRAQLADAGREISDLELTVSPRGKIDAEMVEAYGRLGIDRLVLVPRLDASPDQVAQFARQHAPG